MATILVVDDEEPVVDLLTDMLQEEGHSVVPAYNGRVALQLVNERRPDLVISDVMMPFVDGLQLSRTIREEYDAERLPIILMSAALPPNLEECGANAFLGKPFDIDRFDQLVSTYVPNHGSGKGSAT
jgi:two-component system response regulator VicR